MSLPINITDLLHGRTIEWERLEFKQRWNPEEVVHSLCAFANDVNNWGGGYIIVGVAENNGQPLLPPSGLQQNQLDAIQGDIIRLGNRISPTYFPICQPYLYEEQHILVLWCPAGDNRPYRAPETLGKQVPYYEYIRIGSHSIRATGDYLRQLHEMTSRIPFDDRINNQATLQNLDLGLIQSHLQEIKSDLFEESQKMSFADLCRVMYIAKGADEDIRPVNVGLLFFNKTPENFFPRTWIELVWHKENTYIEHYFKGQIQKQLRDALSFIQTNIIAEKVIKYSEKAEADRFYNFPYAAIEEALSNAVYHKSYELGSPIEIQIWGDKIEILSYPAAIPPVNKQILNSSNRIVARQYRNRRIGDFLKELHLTEGRATGFPTIYDAMKRNGSPTPVFDTDDNTYFLITLPVHNSFNNESYKENIQASNQVTPLTFNNINDIIDYCTQTSNQASNQASNIIKQYVHGRVKEILLFTESWKSKEEIFKYVGLSNQHKNKTKYLNPLIHYGWVELKYPYNLTHPEQSYIITIAGKRLLALLNN